MDGRVLTERQTLELLAGAELKIAELYRVFAGLFPADAPFWSGLSLDEEAHARWVQALLPRVEASEVIFRAQRLGSEAFVLFDAYLDRVLREVRRTAPSEHAALAIAMDIEGTLVEKIFYDVFEGMDAESVRWLARLNRSSAGHLRRVRLRWQLASACR